MTVSVGGGGTEVHYEGRDLEALQCLYNYRQWIFDHMAPHLKGRIVEIGAGTGNFSELLVPVASELSLVEPSAGPFGILETRFGNAGHVTASRTEALDWALSAETDSADTVVMINVLEHIEDDARLLRELARILAPGGRLCLYVPAMMVLFSEIDRVFGHFRRYGFRELRDRLHETGFDIHAARWMDTLGAPIWFVMCRLMRSTTFNPSLASAYDRLAIPVLRGVEGVIPPPFGKNLLFLCEPRSTETPV